LVHLAWVGEDEGEEPDNDPSLPDTPSLFGGLDMEEVEVAVETLEDMEAEELEEVVAEGGTEEREVEEVD
jgi:hypothetical protein